jgi:hypothetical protein
MAIKYLNILSVSRKVDGRIVQTYGRAYMEHLNSDLLARDIGHELLKYAKVRQEKDDSLDMSLQLTIVLDSPEEGATKMNISKPIRGKP